MHIMYKYEFDTCMKPHRQAVIRELVDHEAITSQEQLRTRLRDRGIEATQATLSRDIRELGLVKRTADGAYRSIGTVGRTNDADAEAGLARVITEYLRSHEVVGNMIVLKTDPGQAQTLAIAIDRANLPEIVGTIGGDDTILVICRTPAASQSVADRFSVMREEG
jgi:transcriptional regulator of arginine metabolism